MSSTEVESASFDVQVTQGIVSSEFPANINAACGFPVFVVQLVGVLFRGFLRVGRDLVLFVGVCL